jgi:hypothetical protein
VQNFMKIARAGILTLLGGLVLWHIRPIFNQESNGNGLRFEKRLGGHNIEGSIWSKINNGRIV